MFTGLIEAVGTLKHVGSRGNYQVLTIAVPFALELGDGESIACDGACLTVVGKRGDTFIVEVSQETSARTTLDTFGAGAKINLERAMRADSRLGGHMVAGHVDTTGTVEHLTPVGESLELAVAFDQQFDPYVIEKGSIAINGVSLTVNAVRQGWLTVNLIPYTVGLTTLCQLKAGDRVNLEFDMIGKYIVKLSLSYQQRGLTLDKLRESGW
jgi:riboflavin synthase